MKFSKEKEIAIKAALAAGKFIKSRLGRIRRISYKGEINLVTDVDKRAELLCIKILKSHFPDHRILAEETAGKVSGCPYRWIIDPLDGTTNFAHGFPFFCTSIALEISCKPVVGVVYDPIRDELFHAMKDKGAYLNKKRIYVSAVSNLRRALLATGFAYNFRQTDRNNIDHFVNFLMVAQAIRRAGSAALDMCYVACGRFDGFWELDLHPWDTAAGSLVVKEAGGRVSLFSGKAYSPYAKEILVSNSKIHKQMIDVLNIWRRKGGYLKYAGKPKKGCNDFISYGRGSCHIKLGEKYFYDIFLNARRNL